MYKLFKKEEWIKALYDVSEYKIFVPVRENNYHIFAPLEKGTTPDFSFFNTRLSPKAVLFPESERMFEFSLDKKDSDAFILKEVEKDFPKQAIVGIRPCDSHAFLIVKRNFDTAEYKDPWWVKRYENTTFVGLGCNRPRSTCFCKSVGGGPFSEKGLDLLMYDIGDSFLIKIITDKGKEFLEKIGGGISPKKEDIEEAEKIKEDAERKIEVNVEIDEILKKGILQLFDSDIWDEISFPCINCGICTYLCPTCWCFDIQDETYRNRGYRIRNWDSCMFPIFTLHASGHNPRAEKFRRVRQRFMHKLRYYPEKYKDGVQCSGCGRCIRACPTNVDIREVAKKMAKI